MGHRCKQYQNLDLMVAETEEESQQAPEIEEVVPDITKEPLVASEPGE